MQKKILILTSLFCLAFILHPSAHAQTRWYQVEVIIFDYLRPNLDGELWFENPGLPSRDLSIELISDIPDPIDSIEAIKTKESSTEEQEGDDVEDLVPYLSLSEDEFRLKADYRRLERSPNYRPLMHVAWQQEGLALSQVRKIHLEKLTEESEPKTKEEIPEPGLETETENGIENEEILDVPVAEEIYIAPEMIIDGFVRLQLRNFLHLDIDFSYFPEDIQKILRTQSNVNTEKMVNKDVDYVRLTENRKISLNELNYFDHPLFGILVQVSRRTVPEKT